MDKIASAILLLTTISSASSYSTGSNVNPRSDNVIYSAATGTNQAQNTQPFLSYGSGSDGSSLAIPNTNTQNTASGYSNGFAHKNIGKNTNDVTGVQHSLSAGIDPHYVFGSPQSAPILTNIPIFPYNSPTTAPKFQQFPQPNHPGSVMNPAYPHGLQPGNLHNSPFVFGLSPYSGSSSTGTLPGGGNGILGGSGGGLAPPPYGSYQNPSVYNPSPPQYQNQNPSNRQSKSHSSSITYDGSGKRNLLLMAVILAVMHGFFHKILFWCDT